MLVILPRPALRPFIGRLWASTSASRPAESREHVLPTGQMHMVFRLAGKPLRLFADADDRLGRRIAAPVLGGARTSFYIKEAAEPVVSVGVELLPGAPQALFGVGAGELAGRHTPLSELWGRTADSLLQQLAEETDPQRQLVRLESSLAAHFPSEATLHPSVLCALAAFARPGRIDDVVLESRYSHRGFIALFRQATGVSPKRYARLMRFQALLASMRAHPGASLGELAYGAGYSDQAHMTREFREFAGVTPSQYRGLAPAAAHHVALPGPQEGQFHSRRTGTRKL
ncbi:AraC family transcriptional regulator [Massilia sp. DD77]|uniref:AraC family transcriptional regulator n=1 Tax=Massilia sp. DD77 TaxID=3109349 RepID=UPI003000368F